MVEPHPGSIIIAVIIIIIIIVVDVGVTEMGTKTKPLSTMALCTTTAARWTIQFTEKLVVDPSINPPLAIIS